MQCSDIRGFNAEIFIQRIEERRIELKIRSERALAVRAGLSPNYLRNIRVRQAGLTAEGLMRLASTLCCTTDHLLGRDGNMAPAPAERTVQAGE